MSTLMKKINDTRLLQYSEIRWISDGEPISADVLNRPSYDIVKSITDKYYDNNQLNASSGAGNIGCTSKEKSIKTVQDAITNFENKMVLSTVKITTGNGLTGGGEIGGGMNIKVDEEWLKLFIAEYVSKNIAPLISGAMISGAMIDINKGIDVGTGG